MKKLRFVVLGAPVALFLSTCLGAGEARAQGRTGFAINRFEPAERGSQFFVNDTLDLRGKGRPAFGAVLDYGYKPLVVYDLEGNERSAIVRHQLFTHLGGGITLADFVRLSANLPIALYQDGENSIVNNEAFKAADKPAVGDVRLAADVALLGKYGDPLVFAAGVRAWIPTGQRSQFTGDGAFRFAPQAMVAGDIDVFTYAARLAIQYRARDDAYAGSSLGSEILGAVGAGLKTLDGKLVIGPEVYASSVFTDSNAFFKTRGTPAEWLFGLHHSIGDFRVGAGVGGGLTRGYGAPQLRTLLSLEYVASAECSDRDKDGVCDDEDACKDVPGLRNPDPTHNGCPAPAAPVPDRDGDGVYDHEDACPDQPGRRRDDPATSGCPDKDGDGIVDKFDACPDVPGVKDPDPKKNGCPPDRDGDGVPDAEDACVDVPGVRDPDPKKNGCPPDTDGDGILDPDDACPKVAGPRNPDPKKNGCPLVYVTEREVKITEQIKFKFDSADILPESDGLLTSIKKVIDEHPELKKIRIEGHTDSVGNADYNKKLSERRAQSVMKWLTDRGVKKERLAAQGFGQDEPIDTNDTDAGRANNRRVAFTILERDENAKPNTQNPPAPPAPPPAPAPKP